MEQYFAVIYRFIFILKNSSLNPFVNRKLFCGIPVLVGWFFARYFHAMYQTADDWDMRILLEGSAGGYISTPSEFTLYMNILYGKILKVFYTIYQNGYWYDIFTYFFCSVSVYIITLALCKNFLSDNWFYKSIVLLVVSLVSATCFVSPQFTITSSILAISGVLSFFMLVTNYFSDTKSNILCTIYCFCSLVFSSLIRFESCMILSFYTGILLLPYWPYHDWKKLFKKSILIFSTLLVILGTVYIDNYFVSINPDWYELRQFNIYRVNIGDKTNMWDNLDEPWKDIEDKLTGSNDYIFSKGDYRLLLTISYLKNNMVFNSSNFKKISDNLSEGVQSSNKVSMGFRVKDFRKVLPSFVLLALILGMLSFTTWKQSLFACSVFFLFIVGLSYEFRALPYRLWYNFALATIVAIMLTANFKTTKKIFIKLVVLIVISLPSYIIMHNQAISTMYQYNVLRQFRSEIKKLPDKYLYLYDYANNEHIGKPFSKNILTNSILLSPLNFDKKYDNLLDRYNVSEDDPWDDICSKDSNIRILHNQNVYNAPLVALKRALSFYMLEKYGKHVVFIGKYQTKNLITYQCRTLTNEEFTQRENLKNQLEVLQNIIKLNIVKDTCTDFINVFSAESFEK